MSHIFSDVLYFYMLDYVRTNNAVMQKSPGVADLQQLETGMSGWSKYYSVKQCFSCYQFLWNWVIAIGSNI